MGRSTDLRAAHGFSVVARRTITCVPSPEENAAFLRLPVMTEWRLPGLGYAGRMQILDAALQQWDRPPERRDWTYFVVRRAGRVREPTRSHPVGGDRAAGADEGRHGPNR